MSIEDMRKRKVSSKPRFTWLSGDVNYQDYGGKWYSYQGCRCFLIRDLSVSEEKQHFNYLEPSEGFKYKITMFDIDLDDMERDLDKVKSACSHAGIVLSQYWEFEDLHRAEVLASYGTGILDDSILYGNNLRKLLKESEGFL